VSAPGSLRVWRRAIVPHRRASRPAGARPSREELSEKRGAQPPTLELGGYRHCIDIAGASGAAVVLVMAVTFPNARSD
jgi:hypothetical protein